MKILRFSASNIRGLKAVEITPAGDVVTLSGPNGAGKSSILNAIEATLCGGPIAIRSGETRAEVEIDLGGKYIVRRVVTDKGDRLEVKSATENAKYGSPRDFLSKLVGSISLDPLGFVRAKPKDQVGALFSMVPGLADSLKAADDKIAKIKQDRSDNLRDQKRLEAELLLPAPEQIEPIDLAVIEAEGKALDAKNEAARVANVAAVAALAEKDRMEAAFTQMAERERELAKELDDLRRSIMDLTRKLAGFVVPAAKEIVDIEPIRAKYRKASAHNVMAATVVAQLAARKSCADSVAKLKESYSDALTALKAAEVARADILASSMPIPGLEVSGGEVLYNGIPISELSTGEKVRVGVAVAKAGNPTAKIILADDVSLLDTKNRAALHEVCGDGYQVWEIINDESGDVGIFIEDGSIKEKAVTNE